MKSKLVLKPFGSVKPSISKAANKSVNSWFEINLVVSGITIILLSSKSFSGIVNIVSKSNTISDIVACIIAEFNKTPILSVIIVESSKSILSKFVIPIPYKAFNKLPISTSEIKSMEFIKSSNRTSLPEISVSAINKIPPSDSSKSNIISETVAWIISEPRSVEIFVSSRSSSVEFSKLSSIPASKLIESKSVIFNTAKAWNMLLISVLIITSTSAESTSTVVVVDPGTTNELVPKLYISLPIVA